MSFANTLFNMFNSKRPRRGPSCRLPGKTVLYFATHATARLSGAGCFSLGLHVFAFTGYVAIASLTAPDVVEIQEVTFIDLTEEPRPEPEPEPEKEEIGLGVKMAAVPTPAPAAEDVPAPGPVPGAEDVAAISLPEPEKPKTAIQIEPTAAAASTKLKPSNLLAFSAPAGADNDKIMVSSTKLNLRRGDERAGASAIQLGHNDRGQKARIALVSHTGSAVGSGIQVSGGGYGSGGGSTDLLLGSGGGKVNITGPLANREIIRKMMPPFPQWAKRKGVGATIALRFTVMEDGTVKENIVVERTSGSGEWDHMVIDALRKWLFAPLGNIGTRFDQNGVITFYFVIT